MVEIKQIDEKFYVEFSGNGLKYRKFAGYTRNDACSLRSKIEDSLKDEHMIFQSRFVVFSDFLQDYLDHCRADLSEVSYERTESTLHIFSEFISAEFQVQFIQDILPGHLEEFRTYLRKIKLFRPARVNLTLFILSLMFDHAASKNYINDSPMFHLRCVDTEQNVKNSASVEDFTDVWLKLKSDHKISPSLSVVSIERILNECYSDQELNPIRVRNSILIRFLKQRVPVRKLSSLVMFKDLARWAILWAKARQEACYE